MVEDLRITLTGTGNPAANLLRSGPSQVVWVGNQPLLIDCGLGTTHQLLRAGIDPVQMTYLFFTHLHSDHSSEYASFAFASWQRGRPWLRVFGPVGTAEMTDYLFRKIYAIDIEYRLSLGKPPDGMNIEVQEVCDSFAYEEGKWRVTAAKVKHHPRLDCFGYRVDYAGKSLVIAGDTTYCESLVELARGADMLVTNCSLCLPPHKRAAAVTEEHWRKVERGLVGELSGPRDAGRMAAQSGVRTLVLTHFQPNPDRQYLLQESAREFNGTIIVGEDLMELYC